MADVHTKEQRSYNMSRIRGSNTKPEIALRKRLWKKGYRYRLKNRDIPGNPDISFRTMKIAVFVDGCFWHKCPDHFVQPENNRSFWLEKILSNVKRDTKVNRILSDQGWTVLRFWEHDIKKNISEVVKIISSTIEVA